MEGVTYYEGQSVCFQYERRRSSRRLGRVVEVAEGRYLVIEWLGGDVSALPWRTVCRFLSVDVCDVLPGVEL